MFRKGAFVLGNMFRDAGRSLDTLGMRLQNNQGFRETLSRHRRIVPLEGSRPSVHDTVFIAPNATIVGAVQLAQNVSVWYGTTLRGDTSSIRVGQYTSIGDRTSINVPDFKRRLKAEFPDTVIGDRVTIGQGVILQGCNLADECVIEMGVIMGEGASVGKHSIVAAGSVVAPEEKIPSGQLWSGSPAQFERNLTAEEVEALLKAAENHYILSRKHVQVLHSFENEIKMMRMIWEGRRPVTEDEEEAAKFVPLFQPDRPEHNHPPIGEVPTRI